MEMKRLICSRNEHPDTCFLVEQEGNDYCMICADRFTLEEHKQIQRETTKEWVAKHLVPLC